MHGNLDPEENVLPDEDEHEDLPKVKLNFDGCYNYNRLKKEGLLDDKITCYVDEDEVDCETWVKPDSDTK